MTSPDGAALSPTPGTKNQPKALPTAVVLVLHGGKAHSRTPALWRTLTVLRLKPFARVIARRVPTAAVYRLKFEIRGWNGDGADAMRDARWALAKLREQHPGLPLVMVGHSMGGRVALRVGGDADVAGVVLLAPWAPPEEPVRQLSGVPVVVIRGGRDIIVPSSSTDPWLAAVREAGALVSATSLPWAEHTLLRRFWVWHRLTADAVLDMLRSTATSSATRRESSL